MTDIKLKPNYTVGMLGCGNLGTAVLNAMIDGKQHAESGTISPGKFLAAVNSKSSEERLKSTYKDKLEQVFVQQNNRLVEQADLIILGCKPFMLDKVVGKIPNDLFKGKVVVSLLAGKTLESLSDVTGHNALVARAMTNTPSKIGEGMTVVSFPESGVDDTVQEAVKWIFEKTGRCMFLEEKHQDVATALCGSGPAFCYLVQEALADGAVRMGMPYALAQECAAQVMRGSGQMVLEEGHPGVLRTKVCTPGGTTIGGLMVLEDNKVRSAVARSVEEATNIATALGKK